MGRAAAVFRKSRRVNWWDFMPDSILEKGPDVLSGPFSFLKHAAKRNQRSSFAYCFIRSRRWRCCGTCFAGFLGQCDAYMVIEAFYDPGLSTCLAGFFFH